MSKPALSEVVSHWHKLVENFQTSPKEFYASVEEALERRKIPGLDTRRVDWNEGGVLSPDREYLRVTGERHSFDMCAAPFGTGFFFSSWVTKRKARFVALYLMLCAALTVLIWVALRALFGQVLAYGMFGLGRMVGSLLQIALSGLIVLWVIALGARAGSLDPEAAILTVPIVGWFYAKMFAPETYYRIDTMLMFQSSVQAAMLEVINELLTAKGLRALGEAEQKPIMRQLVDKEHALADEQLVAAH